MDTNPADNADPTDQGTASLLTKFRRFLRRIYDWTIGWSEKPSALWALFGISFAESSVFPVPPDPLLMAITVVRRKQWLRIAGVCTLGSAIGGLVGYVIGFAFMETIGQQIVDFYHAGEKWNTVVGLYTGEWGVMFLAVAAFTPIPFKVATIAAGATGMPLIPFAITSVLGRGARFFLVAGLLRIFGARIKLIIEKYFDVLALLFLVLLVGGFLALKYLH